MTGILTVIPARGGSKGVPGKNLRSLGGVPLIAHVIRAAKASRYDPRVVCSTDSADIAEVAKRHGAEVPFLRPGNIAGDDVPAIAPVRHALEYFDKQGWRAEIVIQLHPTSPFLTTKIIDDALQTILRNPAMDSVVAVRRIEHNHPFRAYALGEGGILNPLTEYTSEKYLQKQDRPDAYGFVGGLYIRRRHLIEAWNSRDFALGRRTGTVVVPGECAIDIDSELDLIFAQAVIDHFKDR